MVVRYILSEYVEKALSHVSYDKLEDGTFLRKIPSCKGVVAFGNTF
jgi:predicted RNase H-like HicB family nuclease